MFTALLAIHSHRSSFGFARVVKQVCALHLVENFRVEVDTSLHAVLASVRIVRDFQVRIPRSSLFLHAWAAPLPHSPLMHEQRVGLVDNNDSVKRVSVVDLNDSVKRL